MFTLWTHPIDYQQYQLSPETSMMDYDSFGYLYIFMTIGYPGSNIFEPVCHDANSSHGRIEYSYFNEDFRRG